MGATHRFSLYGPNFSHVATIITAQLRKKASVTQYPNGRIQHFHVAAPQVCPRTIATEDDLHRRDARGDELPAELTRRESRLAKIQEAKKALEEQALAAAQKEEARRQAEDGAKCAGGESPRARKPVDPTPEPKARRNIMDRGWMVAKMAYKRVDSCGNVRIVCIADLINRGADVTK